ncbi:Uma2 family endonuclease [Spirosoma sp. KUDC1026]|uniref:Uma2 family endonuclease n=1 Tax=Spirosoma sp. KUDC1026 TaxID=2745947 RepID=UPI00159B99E5|nr:Uma2 family endonuclease [Spirosoma sp. KUDC1026]QKZ14963.1 Uma2 family endonuclease [Spirosoma sp. KUDC1026]
MTAIAKEKPSRRRTSLSTSSIPTALIYEMWQGRPIYYKGYQDVLAGKKTIEEIMSCSDLQGVLVYLLGLYIGNNVNRKKYLISTNESGLHLATNDNLGSDLAIFEKEKVGKLKGKYFDVPPKIAIEVDIKADVADFEGRLDGYLIQKSQKLIEFGVEKVIWIITSAQKVYVIDRNDPTWYIINWSENITVLDDCVLNIKQLLANEEIDF